VNTKGAVLIPAINTSGNFVKAFYKGATTSPVSKNLKKNSF